jgi:hypothetical protein
MFLSIIFTLLSSSYVSNKILYEISYFLESTEVVSTAENKTMWSTLCSFIIILFYLTNNFIISVHSNCIYSLYNIELYIFFYITMWYFNTHIH